MMVEELNYNRIRNGKVAIILLFWPAATILFYYLGYNGGIVSSILGVIFFLLSLNIDEKVLFLLAGLPFAAIFKVAATLPSSLILFYALFILTSMRSRIQNGKAMIWFGALLVNQIISLFVYNNSIVSLMAFILNVLTMKTLIGFYSNKSNNQKKTMFHYSAVVFAISMIEDILLTLLYPNIPFLISSKKAAALAYQNRFSALNADPNYYAQLVVIAVGLLIPLIQKLVDEKKYMRLIAVFSGIVFLSYYGVASLSKSFVISFLVLVALYVSSLILKNKKSAISVLGISCFIVLLIIFANWFYESVLVSVFAQRVNSAGILTGRDVIWNYYFDMFKNNPLTLVLGMGAYNGSNVLGSFADHTYAAHNAYIEMLGDLGIIGFIILFAFLKSGNIRFRYKVFKAEYFFFTMMLITSLALSMSSFDSVYLILPLLICAEGYSNSEQELFQSN